IRESLKNLKLDQTNRAIEWESDDEIGELVEEYNRTLNELVQSAELLARSERESAWREMAKQVAHEIKNPLTPMKLSIQMLQRSLADGKEDMTERIEKVAKTLIEQIDTLSNIATEFSTFAQMPKPVVENLSLADLLESAAELHRSADTDIQLNIVAGSSCIIQADKEQMLRVFTNLIKNGMQAIPEERKGEITLGLIRDGGQWIASVQDNGSGIPIELEDSIFVPNFTTKTSGMGLGLAMVKNIIETVNGKIWFKTEVGRGTTFYISLPAIDPLS
ncbi:MAG: GHKL domain-containing protein, partial [Flavobacteriales bacterium]|nr:GHKL domain-containing protein [Flavobacteriales bacterium]